MKHLLSAAAVLAFLPLALPAQSLSGHIVDINGLPVANVAVILSNGAPTGTTNANGDFLITGLSNRDYDVEIDPHSATLAPQAFQFTVSGASTFGTLVLQPGAEVFGVVTGPTGTGLLGVNMNAYMLNGTKLFTPHDGSDALGNVSITVPYGPVRIRANPPVGSNLVPFEQVFDVTGPIDLGTVMLRQGYVLSGSVVRSGAVPTGVSGCELITRDVLTGEEVFQQNKLTGTFGQFSLLIPALRLFEIDIVPPAGALFTGRQLVGVFVINGPKSLGTITIDPAVVLSGQVLGPLGPVVGADVDVYTSNGHKLFTPRDNTNAAGVWAVTVKPGSYSVRVDPQFASGLVGLRTGLINVPANTNIGPLNLVAGVSLSLAITDQGAAPVAKANLDVIDPVTGQKLVVVGDIADDNGLLNATIPVGTWNFRIKAPQGSLSAPFAIDNFPITGPLSLPISLPDKDVLINVSGHQPFTVPNGGLLPLDWTFGNLTSQTQPVTVEAVVALPSGVDVVLLPPLPLDLIPLFGLTLPLNVPTPVLPANELGFVQRFTVRFRGKVSGQVLDEAYIQYMPL